MGLSHMRRLHRCVITEHKRSGTTEKMKALILAAGYGRRLQPVTNEIPKSMVEVAGRPLLFRTLDHLVALQITEIGIVVGHMADVIRTAVGNLWQGIPIRYFENPRYLETNNVVSLYEARTFCDEEMLMLECDLCYERSMLEALCAGAGDCDILVSPYNPKTMDGSVVRTAGDTALALIPAKQQGTDFDYTNVKKTVNCYRFSGRFAKAYLPLVAWYVEHVGEDRYYEEILASLMALRAFDVRVVEVPADVWCEIDDAEDLARARARFGGAT